MKSKKIKAIRKKIKDDIGPYKLFKPIAQIIRLEISYMKRW
jgi:hypothetical protein